MGNFILEQNKKLLDIEEKIKQLKAQKQAIINKKKEKERKARTKRLYVNRYYKHIGNIYRNQWQWTLYFY